MIFAAYTPKFKPNSCPRCGGDMFIDNDEDGWYEKCIQCSHTIGSDKESDSVKIGTPNHTAPILEEKSKLKSGLMPGLPSRISHKESSPLILTEEEWQALKRQNSSREMRTKQAERVSLNKPLAQASERAR